MVLDFVHYLLEVAQIDDTFVRLAVHHERRHHRLVAAFRQQLDRVVHQRQLEPRQSPGKEVEAAPGDLRGAL